MADRSPRQFHKARPIPAALAALLAALWLLGGSSMGYQSPALAADTPGSADTVYMESDVTEEAQAGETRLLSGDIPPYVQQLLDVAIQELGYTEGANNRTKYGEWAGDPNAAWCAEFLCWCVSQVDAQQGTSLLTHIYPNYGGQNTGRDWFISRGRFVYRKGNCPDWGYQWILGESQLLQKNGYIPQPGDWVFFSYNEAGDTEHVAMIEYTAKDVQGNIVLHVIEGNNPSTVSRNRYYLNNSQILGFGTPAQRVGTTMRGGNQGEPVLKLQEYLHSLGLLDAQHITGTYGTNTKAAVANFQRTRMEDKAASGIADMDTQIAIANLIAAQQFEAPENWLVTE